MQHDKRPKVAVIANRLGSFGGGERWVCEMASRLNGELSLNIINPVSGNDTVRIEDAKLKSLFGFGDAKITEIKCHGVLYRLQDRIGVVVLFPSLDSLIRLNRSIAESEVVYEVSFNPFLFFWSFVFARLNGKRFIVGLHNPDFLVGQKLKGRTMLGSLLQNIILSLVREIHAQTESQMKLLGECGYKGRVYYIPHYLYFRIKKKEALSYGSRFEVLLSGRLSVYQKGIDLLEDVVKATLSVDGSVSFTIIGSGEGEKIAENLQKRYPGNVSYMGFVSEKVLKMRYMRASLFILTSRYETPGLALLEAQSYGIPAVAFNVIGPKDIMKDRVQGAMVPEFDTGRFSLEIIRFRKLFGNKKEYRERRARIWAEIRRRYGAGSFENRFVAMIRKAD